MMLHFLFTLNYTQLFSLPDKLELRVSDKGNKCSVWQNRYCKLTRPVEEILVISENKKKKLWNVFFSNCLCCGRLQSGCYTPGGLTYKDTKTWCRRGNVCYAFICVICVLLKQVVKNLISCWNPSPQWILWQNIWAQKYVCLKVEEMDWRFW